jgi:4-amino-4-deoxy-L-arabinose transferase-like glycosyltransferase
MHPASALPRERGWNGLGTAGILALTLWRVALLPFVGVDLFVDDAQYWLWGKELAFGYFSKPPLIGWILALSTAIGGDGAFWIRLPMPLIHAGTALLLMTTAARLWDERTGAVAGLTFASLPAVGLGSVLLSTDTPMLFCFALGLLAWTHLAERRSAGWALLLGAALGFGMLAKYAMAYFLPGAVLAALLGWRIAPRDAAIAFVAALVLLAPNLWWNLTNGFATVAHTADNAGWDGLRLEFAAWAEFFGSQFGVAGPFVFAAFLAASVAVLRGRAEPPLVLVVAFALPVLVIVSGQALISRALANWAAATYAGGTLAAAAILVRRPRWLAIGLGFNLALAIAFPLAITRPEALAWDGRSAFERQLGRHEVSHRIAAIAEDQGLDTIVARSRDLLADMAWTLRDMPLVIHAEPLPGPPSHHYAQTRPLPADAAGDVLFVGPAPPSCTGAAEPRRVVAWTPERGFMRREIAVWRVDPACWR